MTVTPIRPEMMTPAALLRQLQVRDRRIGDLEERLHELTLRLEALELRRPNPRVIAPGRDWTLTERQLEVLAGVARGLTDAQIGAELGIKATSVKTHLKQIGNKLHISSRAGKAMAAVQAGLLSPN